MNLIRIKQKTTILGILLLGVFACVGVGAFALNETKANAQTILNDTSATLFLPESYEQYLELTEPSYIAVSSRHVAIADGNNLFIYDRTDDKYTCYKHNGLGDTNHKVTNVQIAETDNGDRIFFSDESSRLFEFSSNSSSAQDMLIHDVSCSTFLIDPSGSYLFTATSSENLFMFHRYALSQEINATNGASSEAVLTNVIPRMTYYENKLYCVIDTSTLLSYSVQKENGTEKLTQSKEFSFLNSDSAKIVGLQSVCVYNGMLYYTVNGTDTTQNGIWQADFSGNATHIETGNGFSTLSVYADGLYCIKNTSVLKLAENGTCPTYPSYEISSSSNSVNRLSNAQDIVRAGNLLVMADTGNKRITVYDMQKHSFAVIPVDYSPMFVATDGKNVAAAATDGIYTYACDIRGNWEQAERSTLDNRDTIKGITCVFGKVYYVSAHMRGVLGGTPVFNKTTAKGLAANLYGDLFVAYEGNTVARFTEETFIKDGEGEKQDFTLPDEFTFLRADFEGNLYCLNSDKVLCKFTQDAATGEELATINAKDFVYSKDGASLSPVSFALGFEDDAVYFNFGNFMVKTAAGALGFPTLSTIDATGIYEELQKVHTPEEVRHMDVKKGAVGIEVDLSSLGEDTDCFPFHAYQRTADSYRGALLTEKENYLLIALYHDKGYDVRLFRKEQCTEAETETMESTGEKFLSSSCNLYHYPCIADAASEALPRGTRVKVLSVVKADPDSAAPDLGYDFAYIEVESKARETKRGYVPLSFLTDADPAGSGSEEFEIVKLKQDTVFTDGSGEKTLSKGTEVKLYTDEDGNYTGRFTDEAGKVWSQQLTEEMIYRGESDALRIALIVVLSVLALVIIGAYFALLPHEKKR